MSRDEATMLLLLSSLASAGTVEVWAYDDFPNQEYLDGYDGWMGGFGEDPWYGYRLDDGSGWALPLTDMNTSDRGGEGDWGDGGALDNWLVNDAADVGDGVFTADFYSQDDDSIGLVIGSQDASDYYMFVLCGAMRSSGADCPLELEAGTSAIVRIQDGAATILARDRSSYEANTGGTLSLALNDGVLTAEAPDQGITMTVEDQAFDTVNGVGFWAYDAGAGAGDTETYVAFGHALLSAFDDDDDGVIDDEDACEFEAAVHDADGDGCEDAEGDADTDTDADTDADSDADTDTDTGGSPDGGGGTNKGGGLNTPGGCSCDTNAPGAAGLAPVLLLAAAARRRRA